MSILHWIKNYFQNEKKMLENKSIWWKKNKQKYLILESYEI